MRKRGMGRERKERAWEMRREGEERGWEKGGGEVGGEEDREMEMAAKSWKEKESPKEVKGRGKRGRWGEGSRIGLARTQAALKFGLLFLHVFFSPWPQFSHLHSGNKKNHLAGFPETEVQGV